MYLKVPINLYRNSMSLLIVKFYLKSSFEVRAYCLFLNRVCDCVQSSNFKVKVKTQRAQLSGYLLITEFKNKIIYLNYSHIM